MDVTTQLELCLHEQTQMVANAAYGVGIGSNFLARLLPTCFLTFYYDPYFLLNFFIKMIK